ncbi:MAG: HAMP domain-containing protein [Tissierellia bacterium]|nr:HAMP domain-containing protein [Tissierellia bacterium]
MRNDIENKILIPFMLLLILSILVLTIISIANSYKLILDNEGNYSRRELDNILVYMDYTKDEVQDEDEASQIVLDYLKERNIENFFLVHSDEYLIKNINIKDDFFNSQAYLLIYEEYEDYDWTLGYCLEKSSLFYEVLDNERYLILVSIIVMIISMQVTIIVSYSISKPIKQLAAYCDKIIDSSSFNEKIDIKRIDEIGILSDALNNMIARLEENNERLIEMKSLSTIGQFAAGIAHEIRNPLTGMKTSIQVLKYRLCKEDNSTNGRLFDGVISEIDRINELITGLLDFSRPRAPSFQETKLLNVIDMTLKGINKAEEGKNIEINLKYEEDIIIWADNFHIKQILLNILNNAIHSIESRGVIDIIIKRIEKDDGHDDLVEVQIQDNGCGIDEKNLNKLFTPFFTTRKKGTGLGLSIVYELVKINKGTIKINSVLNEGTQVIMQFPIYGVEENEEENTNN